MTTTTDIPGYKAGTWVLDASHSEVGFSVRHMMISKVRGTFAVAEATIVAPENPLELTLDAKVDVASINTKDEGRDNHLRSADFFDVEKYPNITFVSTGVRQQGGDFLVDGDLTIKDVTKPVTFEVEFGGFGTDPWGNYKAGATAKTVINREEFGLTWNAALETGGVLVGKDVTIELDLQGSIQA
ncbi:polyisoprenoid-binding protein [Microbacterium sp. AISO3]|jgi:polyisoprenoid-binding protein YceI|uniref:Polyisoprenoid-binding protein YceI n=2 Tax=Microbacterium TaxID=33882 RepID=A0ABU1I5N3_9MICO|nr:MULTISPECIES: YceI family protein [Microbacterium]APF33816.1 polyisoprenoid-binding protein [Microbacterium paludicola]MCZ4066995.1 YceI family protein [Microbacterium sp. H37-C3]MDR6168961.1 polyisoprenoid-binding protein YceI [Microbacterium paludicola]OAZ39077.1 polyisoprenoid-binding protein [Microbacterium arborescens]OWP21089.1 polyisoprenoid-binding protein [Microbacterium sp. AISO3]